VVYRPSGKLRRFAVGFTTFVRQDSRMNISSRDLYRHLRTSTADAFGRLGFRPARAARLSYSMPYDAEFLTIWFQADRYGWDVLWGSEFTLEFQLGPATDPGSAAITARSRYAHLLSPSALEEVRDLNNRVISSLPGSVANQSIVVADDTGNEVVVVGARVEVSPYARGQDVWMRYYSANDIESWSTFLCAQVPDLVARFIASRSGGP
jgi:hypothetical protein